MAKREHPRYENMEWPDWEFQEYPMMYYPGAPNQKKPYIHAPGSVDHGKPLKGVIVNNDEELKSLIEADRRAAAGEESGIELTATSAKGVSRVRTEADVKAELIEHCEAAGVTFDRRWGIAKLQEAIDEHERLLAEASGKDVV
jgi:hypothetical protein